MNRSYVKSAAALVAVTAAALLAACQEDKPAQPMKTAAPAPTAKMAAAPEPKKDEIDPDRLAMFNPLPAAMESPANPITDAKVELGRQLYYETRLSKNQDISCNTCHDLSNNFGAEAKETSTGHKGQKGARNSPSVYNAAGHFVQFWDGRAATVEDQAKAPITNPIEMAMPDDKKVVEVLKSIPPYVDAFKKAFPDDKDPVTFDNTAKAIAAFERKLVTPSRWDKFLKGDKSALTSDEKAGFNAFLDAGCAACHTGAYLGGAVYQKAGLIKPWPNQKDLGRFDVTKNDIDKMMFKVPTLRNVTKTAPYFHDGSAKTLEEAVKTMASLQSGKELKDSEVKSIVAFLETLTGDIPKDSDQGAGAAQVDGEDAEAGSQVIPLSPAGVPPAGEPT
ncbi:MAG: cytochrome-c peroxidase [Minicystis sp.]